MIEKLSKKEIEQLIEELSEQGYDIKERDKSKIMKQEAKNALN
jgi:biotin operon repressor